MAESNPGPGRDETPTAPKSRLAEFVDELRRRRVFRALVGWAVLSFAVLQVIEPLMHGFDLPGWTLRAAIWTLAAGFPLTAVLSWLFDLGPRGITRTSEPAAAASVADVPKRLGFSPRLAVLVAASALVGAGLAGVALRRADRVPSPDADGRITIAVADFANETRDPDLDALSGLLITSLEQSQRLRVMTRGRMLELIEQTGHQGTRRIDEGLAREVGRRAGVAALLLATVRQFDDLYTVEVQALDPSREEYLFTAKVVGPGKKSVPGLVDELSEKARRHLIDGRPEAGEAMTVAGNVTADLEAYGHFFAGVTCLDRESFFRLGPCVPDFERAVARDPGFTLAHAYLANLRAFVGGSGLEQSRQAALSSLDRVPPRERAKVLFLAATDQPRPWLVSKGKEALEASPEDRYLGFRLAQMMGYEGDLPGAIPILRAVVDAHPTGQSTAWYLLVAALGAAGRHDELRVLAARLAAGPQTHVTLEALMVARGFLGDGAGVLEAGQRMAEASPPERREEANERVRLTRLKLGDPAVERELIALAEGNPDHLVTLAFLRTLQGRRREATRTVESWAAAPVAARRRVNELQLPWNSAPFMAANLLVGLGDLRLAGRYGERVPVDRMAAPAGATVSSERASLATAFAYAGAADRAATFTPFLAGRVFHSKLHEAMVLWRSGDRPGARRLLEDLASRTRVSWRPAPLPPSFLLGELAAEMGDDRRAVEALRDYRGCWLAWSSPHEAWVYPRALYLAARSHARLGEAHEARALLDELLGWWKRADPDLPLLAESRRLRARLVTALPHR